MQILFSVFATCSMSTCHSAGNSHSSNTTLFSTPYPLPLVCLLSIFHGRVRHSKLTPFLERLQPRWQEGCTNASQLWRELRQEGFTGSRGLVARWAAQQRQGLPVQLRYRRQQAPDCS